MQWKNFASWLIIGGLIFGGFALLWALVDLFRAGQDGRRPIVYFLLLLAAWILGFIDELVHAKDAWASMPEGSHHIRSRGRARDSSDGTRLFHPACARAIMNTQKLLPLVALSVLLSACGKDTETAQYGADPKLPEPHRGLLPTMKIASPADWGEQSPKVPQGY